MKKLIYLYCLAMLPPTLYSQGGNGVQTGPALNMFVLRKENDKLIPQGGNEFNGTMRYFDESNNWLGTEEFSGVVGPGSSIHVNLTEGQNQDPPGFFNEPGFWTLMERAEVEGVIKDGSNDFGYYYDLFFDRVPTSHHANSAGAISGYRYDNEYNASWESILNPMPGMQTDFTILKDNTTTGDNIISSFPVQELMRLAQIKSEFNKTEIPTIIVDPAEVSRAWMFGRQTENVESWLNFFAPPGAADVYNFAGFVVPGGIFQGFTDDGSTSRTEPHPMAAIFGDNSLNEMGTGVFGKGETTGVYGQGKNGTIGVTTGDQNGSATTAFVGAPPATGGFKYGLYANSNSHPNTWAAGIFGSGFYTGSWMMSSDEKLKTQITPQTDALNKVMELKPATYKYRGGTPYSFTEKIHHGFLAQEVEAIFPELVENIKMPADPSPEKMASSPVREFKGIDYTGMISILTGAIQEMNTAFHAKIAEQAAEIEALRKLIND